GLLELLRREPVADRLVEIDAVIALVGLLDGRDLRAAVAVQRREHRLRVGAVERGGDVARLLVDLLLVDLSLGAILGEAERGRGLVLFGEELLPLREDLRLRLLVLRQKLRRRARRRHDAGAEDAFQRLGGALQLLEIVLAGGHALLGGVRRRGRRRLGPRRRRLLGRLRGRGAGGLVRHRGGGPCG